MFGRKITANSTKDKNSQKRVTGKRRIGDKAERIAEAHITAEQHHVLFRNHQCRSGELDLIALDLVANELAIIEVRYRESSDFGAAAGSVDSRKQRRIIAATGDFLTKNPQYSEANIRFDIVAISGDLESPQCQWIRNAFDAL